MVDAAFFGGDSLPLMPLPAGVKFVRTPEELSGRRWEVLALSGNGCRVLSDTPGLVCACGTVLLPGEWGMLAQRQIRAERVVSCGLSARNSLTFSSLGETGTVACVQRAMLRPDGEWVEPQEFPLPPLRGAPEDILCAMGLGLLV